MIFFIYGTDYYRCQQKLKELKDGFIQKRDKSGLNVVTLDGEKIDFDQIKQEALATPFLGEKKMIVVKNILQNKKVPKELMEFIKTRGETIDNVLCFFSPQKPGGYKPTGQLFQLLAKQKFAWCFDLMTDRGLSAWLKNYLTEKNITMEPAAINELVALVGNDLAALTKEIDKLVAYCHGKKITSADVKIMVRAKFDDNIFNLVDALGQKNKKLALKLLADQINSGNHELMILKMISRQFKILLQIKSDGPTVTPDINPYVLRKVGPQAKNFTLGQLLKIYQSLITIESQIKTGRHEPELLLNLFIAKNC